MSSNLINYKIGEDSYEGFFAASEKENSPCVLIAHTWAGRDKFVEDKAEELAKLGFNAFAVDMYGEGKVGTSNEENQSMMQPLLDDRNKLAEIISAAYTAVCNIPRVDNSKIAIMGYCFGGLVSLDLARTGADIKGAVSFHGFLAGSEELENAPIKSKILALHGNLDPMVGDDQVQAFSKEMDEKKVDWQFHAFGNAMHSFTNPEANDPSFGTVYSREADQRSWKMLVDFLEEIFI